ncbi:MAG: efflux RND transporter permease subunit [Pirellulaceae bacterium]|nr:efflux RND transporter permease subunit [Pirellulaceae bacterium]
MQSKSFILENPVKVAVGVILVVMFGLIAAFQMPMQLSPEVERPVISIRTNWRGASPQEIEKEIVNEQEEQLKSVAGVVRMTSESSDSRAEVELEFAVGTDMKEALLTVNSALQQVRDYPMDADRPRISTSSNSDRSIAWFILSAAPPSLQQLDDFVVQYPALRDEIEHVRVAYDSSPGLSAFRLREFVDAHPEAIELLPAEIDVTQMRKFAEDVIEASFERVSGVGNADVRGGQERELQVRVDPARLAARGLTIGDVTQVLRQENQDVSAGDFWEGKRRYVVRTLGQYETEEEVANQIIRNADGNPIYIRDVAEVSIGFKKPTGFVRRYGVSNISISISREVGSNVFDVMQGLQREQTRLNETVLKNKGLMLTQVYDETLYIDSAISLVNQNIVLGSALTVIILMLFLHMGGRTLTFVPLLAGSAIAAVWVSPWFFILTLLLILIAGFWFARGTLVVAMAIPISIIGTFLLLKGMDRTLNVISLAGLAFAVGMLVDNAVVVLENIYRYYQQGYSPRESARRGVQEVWGAVLASTLTTLFVFLPVIFLRGEAGQLFADIALAISSAVGLSLLVSVLVIPTAASRILSRRKTEQSQTGLAIRIQKIARGLSDRIIHWNAWIQRGLGRRLVVAFGLIALAIGLAWWLKPEIEYLPSGNRNLVFCRVMPPPGYNVEQMGSMGEQVEKALRPYWDVDLNSSQAGQMEYPAIADFFYVARGQMVFVGLRANDPMRARELIPLLQSKLKGLFPGVIVVASQSSIFGRGLGGGRNIEVQVVGPKLEQLVNVGGQIMRGVKREFTPDTQARPVPSLDLSSPELHVTAKPVMASQLGMTNSEIGSTVNTLIDGAYVGDYFVQGEKIDLVVLGSDSYRGKTQDLRQEYVATPSRRNPVRLDSFADIELGSGPQQINHSERQRTVSIEVTPPDDISLEKAISIIQQNIVGDLEQRGELEGGYQIILSGTADKLAVTWTELKWNILLAILITYLLMAALFESFAYPLVIILSVPMGAVGGLLGLKCLGFYLALRGDPIQNLDVLTMLGFVILIGTVVNNAILIVHQALLQIRTQGQTPAAAVLEGVRKRIRPIFMTTATTVCGLSPLVFFPGAGSELYRGLGSVVLGGLVISTIFTLFLIPTLFTLMVDAQNALAKNYADAESEPATLPTQSETDHAEGAEDSAPASHATDESEATEDEPAKDTSETEAPVSTNTGS